jgi:hypothetical protein
MAFRESKFNSYLVSKNVLELGTQLKVPPQRITVTTTSAALLHMEVHTTFKSEMEKWLVLTESILCM